MNPNLTRSQSEALKRLYDILLLYQEADRRARLVGARTCFMRGDSSIFSAIHPGTRQVLLREGYIVEEDEQLIITPAGITAIGLRPPQIRYIDTDFIQIGVGRNDNGAWHRAIAVARDMRANEIWDGNSPIIIEDPYSTHGDMVGIHSIAPNFMQTERGLVVFPSLTDKELAVLKRVHEQGTDEARLTRLEYYTRFDPVVRRAGCWHLTAVGQHLLNLYAELAAIPE